MKRPPRRFVVGALATGAILGAAPAANAAGLDTGFGVNGLALTPLSASDSDRYQAAAPAPGGGTYNVGYTTVSGTNRAFAISKVDAAGQLDPSFGTGGVAVVDVAPGPFIPGPPPPAPAGAPAQAGPTGAAETAKAVGVQPDGKIVVVGQAETLQDGSKPDSRDLDVYAVRLNSNGSLDTSFGGAGITRIDLSDGVGQYPPEATTTTVTTDQSAYSRVHIRANGKIVFAASKGTDAEEPARTDREIAAVQLTAFGALDATFGTGGIAVSPHPEINENLRMTVLDGEKLVVTSYSNIGGANRPFIYRFNENGSVDTTFAAGGDTPGIASALVAGPAPGMAEAYGVALHQGKYVISGYGIRSTTPEFGVDAILYRFNQDGTWDESFGINGLASYNRPDGVTAHFADRARNLLVLDDERIVTAGQSGPDALMTVFNANGTPDTSVSPDGGIVIDLGGDGDALWGIAEPSAAKVVAAGFKTTSSSPADDDAALAKLDLTVPVDPGSPGGGGGGVGGGGGGGATTPIADPESPTPADPSPPAAVVTTTAPATSPAAPKARTAGRVSINCKRVSRKRARCTVTQRNVGSGMARIALKRTGGGKSQTLSGRSRVRANGKSVITLKTKKALREGRFVATIKLPTPAGTTASIKRTITVR